MIAETAGLPTETVRQVVVLAGGIATTAGIAQLLWFRQKQAINEARQLRQATGVDREKAEREAEQARVERRAAEHERRNAENITMLSTMQLNESQAQLTACRESEKRLRDDISRYQTDLDFKGSEIVELRAQVVELRRIIRVRFSDEPQRRTDVPGAEHEREDP